MLLSKLVAYHLSMLMKAQTSDQEEAQITEEAELA